MPTAARLALLALALAGCGSRAHPAAPPPSGWIPVAGMSCADGSPTGIGVSPGSSGAVLFYLSGGGACWSDAACNVAFRSFGQAEYELVQALASGSIFDRSLAGNPFASWTFVFVPYCTGDVHAGDAVRSYDGVTTWNHHGWRNLQAAVAAAAALLPRPAEVVVAGSSAGGFGALAAFGPVRAAWDAAGGTTADLLDDSGPTFVGTAMPPALLSAWWDAWGLASTIGVRCPACETDLSALWSLLAADHPGDRLALLSTTQDQTMRDFLADPSLGVTAMDGPTFEADLAALAASLAALGPDVATYQAAGTDHALLVDASFLASSAGPPLLGWVSDLASGAPWSSAGP